MELATTPAAPRRMIRRLIPWTLSLGLFAGGGYGVYAYAVPKKTDPAPGDATPATGAVAAKSTPTANDQIKQLFSSPPNVATNDRYGAYASGGASAPKLPPAQNPEQDEVATPRSAATLAPPVNPFATTPLASPGDRYSAPPAGAPTNESTSVPEADAAKAPANVLPAGKRTAEAAAPADEPTEIARGQEPAGTNPLRASAGRTAQSGNADGARAAFSEQAVIAQPKSLNLAAAPRQAADAVAGSAGSLPAASPATAGGVRYGADAAESSAAVSASSAVSEESYAAVEPTPAEPTLAQPPASRIATATPPGPPLSRQQPPTFASEIQQEAEAAPLIKTDPGITPTPGLAATDGAGRPGERILEGVQNPAVTIQKLAPQEIQVGKKCTFAVRVQNNSQRTAHDVQIRDEVPQGTQLVGTAPKATVSGSQVVWDLGTLSAGEERIVEMELVPTDEGELGSIATVSFAAQASAKVRCTRPELALRLTAGPRVMIGQQHLVEIEVSNPGSGDATGVMLLETVPAGVSHEAGPALEFEVGTLGPGQSRRLDLVLTAEQAGRINNMMTARADASLEVQAGCEFEVVAPNLKVSVNGPKQRFLERPAKFTMSVNNPGTAPAKEVQLITQLPKGLQFVSANNMGEYDAATHSVHWSLAELPANEHGTVELTALPVEPGEHTLQVASRAEQGLEDSTEARVMVEGLVALSFEVVAADGAVEVGGETTYDVTVTNQGSKPAANVQVIAAIPQGLRATNGQGATRHVVQGDRVVFAPLAQLAPKAEAKFRVQVQGLRAGDQRTKFMVTADEVQEPITKEQGTLVYADQ